MANFETSYKLLARAEGIWSCDALDAGGETIFGVARNYFPSWPGWTYIDRTKLNGVPQLSRLTPEQRMRLDTAVMDFYRDNFWNRFLGSQIPDSLQSIANELLDTSVNLGVHAGVTFLQRALNVLNRDGREYPDLVEDGEFGAATLRTLKLFAGRGQEEVRVLHKVLNILQGAKYLERMRQSESQERFCRGWLSRVSL